jgi:hypothetical protein
VSEIVAEVFSDAVASSSHILGYGPAEVANNLQVLPPTRLPALACTAMLTAAGAVTCASR